MSESIRTGQQPLFIETLEEAVEATAAVCGGKKAFACVMRPDLADDPEGARKWLLDALNPEHRTQLHIKHALRGCVHARAKYDCHILKHWFDRAAGYEPTEPASAMTPRQKIAARRTMLAAHYQQLADDEAELDRAESMREIRNVRSIER